MKLPSYQWKEINLQESNRLRCLAILMIVLHNFLHHVSDSPGENEFNYSPEKYQYFLDGLWNTPHDCIRILFSYLGHYGVQVFLFLSGYGLAIKYRDSSPQWRPFVKKRLLALYPAVLIAACGYFLYEALLIDDSLSEVLAADGPNLLRQITGVSNFIADNLFSPIGPWWFIGIIVHFYLIAPFILRQKKWNQSSFLLCLIAGSILLEACLDPIFNQKYSYSINFTVLGHIDVIALGMLAAHHKKLTLPAWFLITAGAAFTIGNYNPVAWVLAAISMTIILVPLLRIITKTLSKNNLPDKAMLYLGSISMYLFLCNGYLRHPLIEYARNDPSWYKSICLSIVFLCFALTWATILRWIEKKLTSSAPSCLKCWIGVDDFSRRQGTRKK